MKLYANVRLQHLNTEWQALANFVEESDRRALRAPIVDLQDLDARALIGGRKLIKPFRRPSDALRELHVHLLVVPRLGFLVALPAFAVRTMLLIGR